jgi:ATP-binding cassette subfamily F protein 3
MLISLSQVSKGFAGSELFRDVTFQINPGEKLGLVGRNGVGKTTLLRLILGDIEPDQGQIRRHPHVRMGFMQQIAPPDSGKTLLAEALTVFQTLEELDQEIRRLEAEIESKAKGSELESLLDQYSQLHTRWEAGGGYNYRARTEGVLYGLGFSRSDLHSSAFQLSGGERNRLNLAKLLLSRPNLLLLDEPTNHLDIPAVGWLQNFLIDYPHACIVISHDRYFLDATVDKILEIANRRVEEFPGNYSWYVEECQRRSARRQKAYQTQQELIERTEEFIRRNLAGQKTRQAQSRKKMLEKLDRLEQMTFEATSSRFRFDMHRQSGNRVFHICDLDIGYGRTPVVQGIRFDLYRGERLGIVGPNGSGKTTLVKTLLGDLRPMRGEIQLGPKVEMGFYDQQLEMLNVSATVLEELRLISPFDTDETLRSYLARFLFRGEEVFQQVASLSGGEKSRLALAKLIFGKGNTLILDEPTNHLDIPSCEALEEALEKFPGSLIIVSHDRYLINRICGRLLYLDGEGGSRWFEGTYRELEEMLAGESDQAVQPRKSKPDKMGFPPPSTLKKLSKNELNKLKNQCATLEEQIHKTEAKAQEALRKLNDPALANDFVRLHQLSHQHQELTHQLENLYTEWQKASALMEG